jgi:hypothetical protein
MSIFSQKILLSKKARKYFSKNRTKHISTLLKRKFGDDYSISIVDLGGTPEFWLQNYITIKRNNKITIVNIDDKIGHQSKDSNLTLFVGDATSIPEFKNNSFDLTFSNSAIEHLGSWENMKKFANEARRLSTYYFIQTPNFHFPLEPHIQVPFFQYFPRPIQIWFLKTFNFWFSTNRNINIDNLTEYLDHCQLLTEEQVQFLFPDAKIHKEKFLGLTKSFLISNI